MEKELKMIQESFEASPFFALIGFEVVYMEEGNVKIKLPIQEKHFNANYTLHGGVHATMLDAIMGMTIRSITKTGCTTINLNTNYLNPTETGEIFATGKVSKLGYRLVTAEGELTDEEGNLLAKGIGTFKLLR